MDCDDGTAGARTTENPNFDSSDLADAKSSLQRTNKAMEGEQTGVSTRSQVKKKQAAERALAEAAGEGETIVRFVRPPTDSDSRRPTLFPVVHTLSAKKTPSGPWEEGYEETYEEVADDPNFRKTFRYYKLDGGKDGREAFRKKLGGFYLCTLSVYVFGMGVDVRLPDDAPVRAGELVSVDDRGEGMGLFCQVWCNNSAEEALRVFYAVDKASPYT